MTVLEFLTQFLDQDLTPPDVYLAVLTVVGVDPETPMEDIVTQHIILRDKLG